MSDADHFGQEVDIPEPTKAYALASVKLHKLLESDLPQRKEFRNLKFTGTE